MTTLDERIGAMPPRDAILIRDYIAFLEERRACPPKGPRETAAERSKAYYADAVKRMVEIQAVLKLTDKAAAESYGVTLRTYRNYLAGAPQRCGMKSLRFCDHHNISIDYWISGNGPMFRDKPGAAHLGENVVLFCPRSAVRS